MTKEFQLFTLLCDRPSNRAVRFVPFSPTSPVRRARKTSNGSPGPGCPENVDGNFSSGVEHGVNLKAGWRTFCRLPRKCAIETLIDIYICNAAAVSRLSSVQYLSYLTGRYAGNTGGSSGTRSKKKRRPRTIHIK
ncbi:unnamed protein product [Ectocarpus sp. 12 AP-2014]